MAAPKLTIRQRIIDNLFGYLENMTDPNTGTPVWNNILKENLDDIDALQLPAVGLEEGDETVTDVMFPCIMKTLRVFVEFRFENLLNGGEKGVDVYTKFNYYLGVLQSRLFNDKTLGGLAYDIQEVANTPRIADRTDPRPGGALIIDIRYKHNNTNPYDSLNN